MGSTKNTIKSRVYSWFGILGGCFRSELLYIGKAQDQTFGVRFYKRWELLSRADIQQVLALDEKL